MKNNRSKPKLNVGDLLVQSLTEVLDGVSGGNTKLITRTYELPKLPAFTARQIKAVRDALKMGQPMFAELLGISSKALLELESGRKKPSVTVARLLNAIERNPEAYLAKVQPGKPPAKRRVA